MSFFDDCGEALKDVFEIAGEDAVFVKKDGASIPCKVIIEHDVDFAPVGFQSETWEKGTTIELLLSEIGCNPDRGDEVILSRDGKTYLLMAQTENDGLTSVMVAKVK